MQIKQEFNQTHKIGFDSRQMMPHRLSALSNMSTAASSMIPDSELLDLEGLVPVDSGIEMNLPHEPTQYSSSWVSGTVMSHLSRLRGQSEYGTTPPIPDSSSPFESFMLSKYIRDAEDDFHDGLASRHQPSNLDLQSSSHGSSSSQQLHQHLNNNQSSPASSSNVTESYEDSKQVLMAERRRRRRESHNAVERRRRDNINDKIQELGDLLPEQFSQVSCESSGHSPHSTTSYSSSAYKDLKLHKGTILSKSVDYIRHLQSVIDEQNQRELDFQEIVNNLESALGRPLSQFGPTSAEIALQRPYPATRRHSSSSLSPPVGPPSSSSPVPQYVTPVPYSSSHFL